LRLDRRTSADDSGSGEIDRIAVFGEAGIGAHGAKDDGGDDRNRFGLLDDGIEDGAFGPRVVLLVVQAVLVRAQALRFSGQAGVPVPLKCKGG